MGVPLTAIFRVTLPGASRPVHGPQPGSATLEERRHRSRNGDRERRLGCLWAHREWGDALLPCQRHQRGSVLWKSDGTKTGTAIVKDAVGRDVIGPL